MEEEWSLPEKFWLYKKSYQLLFSSRSLFATLLIEYKLCMKCIFRLYSFEHPKIYNDPEFYIEILPALLQDEQQLNNYDAGQCGLSKFCWLCQQVFQKSYSNRVVKQVQGLVEERGLSNYLQFKLNVRIPNIILLRNIVLARYLYLWYSRQELPKELLELYYKILVLPFQSNKFIDPKLVLKWIIANELNNSTTMTSTADEHPDNLIISIEQEHGDAVGQSSLMNNFKTFLGLQKKKEKAKGRKQCLDLGNEKQDYRCNANNISKIVTLKQNQFQLAMSKITGQEVFWRFVNGHDEGVPLEISWISHKITLLTKNVYLCGRYIKFSRYLSQTPWVVNGKKLTEGSLQEEIEDKIFSLFYPNKKKQEIQTRFHAGGREDIDVRMLKGGRPFVLEFVNPIRSIKTITEEEVMALLPESAMQSVSSTFSSWIRDQKQGSKLQFHSWRVVKLMQLVINFQNPYVQVEQLQQTTESYISVELKAAEMQKIKHYLCYIHSSSETLTQQDKQKLESLTNITLQQLTPLRVLHRRTLMIREKLIHCLKMHLVSRHSAILEVWASAGTYIKEFVHGDLGRTTPNVGGLLDKEVDILQLDVGSLKEGEWEEGDEQLMKLDRLDWMD